MTDRLTELLGKRNVTNSAEELRRYSVAGRTPTLVLFPSSSDQIAEILKLARREGKKILIAGNNSQRLFGSAVEGFDWYVSLKQMNHIIEHEAADLIVTVEAGVTLPQLQKFLDQNQQFLPLDPIRANDRTLGGIVATNSSGPLRLLYGTCRDLVLGLKVVLADGSIIRAGGKTVKNVAGYDLSKLFIGSMGTLGVITEVTFRLFPAPAASQTIWIEFEQLDELLAMSQSIGASNLVISRCEYLNRIFVEKFLAGVDQSKAPHCLLFNVQGPIEMVIAAIEKLQHLARDSGGKNIHKFSKKEGARLWDQMSAVVDKFPFIFQCEVAVPKFSLARVIEAVQQQAIAPDHSIALHAHAGDGIFHIFWGNGKQEKMKPDQCRSTIETLRQIVQSYGGSMVVDNVTVTSEVPVMSPDLIWGKPGNDFDLMKRIKTKYDRPGVFAAGRFMGGL